MSALNFRCRHRISEFPGVECIGIELGARMALWIMERRSLPTWRDIATRFEVSRATAYRWLRAYKNATHAELKSPGWTVDACRFAERYIATVESFTTEQLRDAAMEAGAVREPPDNRSWGIVTRSLAQRGLIRRIGYGTSRKPECHASPIAVWAVVPAGGASITTAGVRHV